MRTVETSQWGAASRNLRLEVQSVLIDSPRPNRETRDLINQQLLEILRCPQDQSALTVADGQLVERLNQRIAAGQIVNLAGQSLDKKIDGGLVRAAGDLMYPVVDGIPVMLPDEAIALSQVK